MTLTPRCAKVIELARETCQNLGSSHLTSAHLIAGLLRLGQGVATNVLLKRCVTIELVELHLLSNPMVAERTRTERGTTVGESTESALSHAEEEATKYGNSYVGTEHLLLSLLAEPSGPAHGFFASMNLDCKDLRRVILEELGVTDDSGQSEQKE